MTKDASINIIASVLGCENAQVEDVTFVSDLPRWDSMAVIALIAECDLKLASVPSAQEVESCRLVTELISLLQSKGEK